ncbi:MAG: alpha/beta hydrolase [Sporichthyaceae bacterium]
MLLDPPRHRLARATATAAALSVLAACGGSDAEPDAAPPPPAAVASQTPSASSTPTPAGALVQDPATDPDLAKFYDQKLTWRPCDTGLECTEVETPIDWADPDGDTIDLAVNRVRATGRRTGSIILNPGGPGGAGTLYTAQTADKFVADVRAEYDVVGFDPRGVGSSSPIDCLTDRQMDRYLGVDPTPDDAADLAEVIKQNQAYVAGCKARGGELLAHVDTVSVVRDVDLLRDLLGDEKLNWLGYSYGTSIGATYAQLFPTRISRMVLDGVVDPALSAEEVILGQTQGFEIAFSAFVKDCVANRPCEIGTSDGEVRTRLAALLKRLDARPLGTRSGRALNESMATYALAYAMYLKQLWPQLRQAMAAAYRGDGSAMLDMADAFLERDANGRYNGNLFEVINAVNCLDRPGPTSAEEVKGLLPELTTASPLFGPFIGWSALACVFWPVPATGRPGPVAAPGAPPILVIGTTKDPATPYTWSVNLAEQLESGTLLTREGDGHIAHGVGNRCIDRAVDRYFLTGETPAEGTTC